MNRAISWLQNIKLRQIVISFLIVLTVLIGTVDIHGNQLQAQAEPVTPEATRYNVDSQDAARNITNESREAVRNTAENTQKAGKNVIDNIREKLNLDEPIDPGTKQAGKQLKDAASRAANAPKRAVENVTDRD